MRLNDKSKKNKEPLENKRTPAKRVKKISVSKEEELKINIETNIISKDKSTQKTHKNEEVVILDNNDEIELTDEINTARKKRRRSSASIE